MVSPFRDICNRLVTYNYLPAAADELRRMPDNQYRDLFQSLTTRERRHFEQALSTAEEKSREFCETHDPKVKEVALQSLCQLRQMKQLHELFQLELGGNPSYFRNICKQLIGDDQDVLTKAVSVQDELTTNFKRLQLIQTLAKTPIDERDAAFAHIVYLIKGCPDRELFHGFLGAVSEQAMATYVTDLHTLLCNVPCENWRGIQAVLAESNKKVALVQCAAAIIPRLERQNSTLVEDVLRELMLHQHFEQYSTISALTQMCQDGHHFIEVVRLLIALSPHDRADILRRIHGLLQGTTSGCVVFHIIQQLARRPLPERNHLHLALALLFRGIDRQNTPGLLIALGPLLGLLIPQNDQFGHPHNPHISQYELQVGREDFEKNPIQLLATVVDLLKREVKQRLRVHILGEPAIDGGGLAKELVTLVPRGVCTALGMARCDSTGLFRPNAESLTLEEEETYQNLGQFFMFCLNAREEYIIGQEFDRSLFTALKLLKEEHLALSFDMMVAHEDGFTELFELFAQMNSEHDQDKRKIDAMRKEGRSEGVLEAMRRELIPCIAIKQGMMSSLFPKDVLRELTAEELSDKLQGKLSGTLVLSKLQFKPEIAQKYRDWVKSFLENCSKDQLKDFLYASSAARAIGNKTISVEQSDDDLPHFHTCSNSIELPFRTITSEKELHKLLKDALELATFYSMI